MAILQKVSAAEAEATYLEGKKSIKSQIIYDKQCGLAIKKETTMNANFSS